MPMSPEEAALLVKLQIMKAERDRYREALEEIAAKLKVATDGLQRMAGHRAMMVANPARQILNQIKQA